MNARRVGRYSLAGLIGTLVAAVASYAAGDTNSLRAACSGDGTEVDASALGSAEDAATGGPTPWLPVAAHHEAHQ